MRITLLSILICSCFMLLGMVSLPYQVSSSSTLKQANISHETSFDQKGVINLPFLNKMMNQYRAINYWQRLLLKLCIKRITKKTASPALVAFGNKLAILSLVAGVLSSIMLLLALTLTESFELLILICPLVAIVGVVLGILALSYRTRKKVLAKMGLVLSGLISLFFIAILLIYGLAFILFLIKFFFVDNYSD